MSNILDNIVNCQITIEAPVSNEASFGVIMLVGKRPKEINGELNLVDLYGSLEEIRAKGWEENDNIYKAAKVAFMQEPKPREIYISVPAQPSLEEKGVEETDETSNPIEEETNSNTGMIDAVDRALETLGWYGLAVTDPEEEDLEKIAERIETHEKIFAFRTEEMRNPFVEKKYMRTFGIYSKEPFIHVAWMASCFALDPGSETWAFRSLTGMEPSKLTTGNIRQLEELELNYYTSCAKKNITLKGKMVGGEWIDVIRFRDWIKNQMQLRIYNLFITHTRIPYTDAGIALVQNQIEATLKEGQEVGGIAETEYDEEGKLVPGYTVNVPKAASLTSAQRASRVLKGCYFTARLAGAIHVVELQGQLNY